MEIVFQCKCKAFPYVNVQIEWFLKLASGNHKKQKLDERLAEKFGIMKDRVGIVHNNYAMHRCVNLNNFYF